MKKSALALAACGTGLLALSACGLSGPQAASGEIIRLEERDAWIETDCVVDTDGPSCTASAEEPCYLVVFEDDRYEYSDCIEQKEWKQLKVGDTYTDRDDSD